MNVPQKILLLHLYSNGDCLYATAIAKQIKQDFPGCRLTWAIAGFCKSIIDNNPFVDEVIIVDTITKNDITALRTTRKEFEKQKRKGIFDQIFFTQPADTNQAYYDGTIRGNVLRSYFKRLTVPVTPVLKLRDEEKRKTEVFVAEHRLSQYQKIILFEFAPQSGQLKINKELAIHIADKIVQQGNIAVILSSAEKIEHKNPAIIDGSRLSLRETAWLTHYCHLLIGCSSGITWASTSDAAKLLPMVQLLDSDAVWMNSVTRDFERNHLPVEQVIEMYRFDVQKIIDCVSDSLNNFAEARIRFHQELPLQFRTTGKIVYNLLCYLEFKSILRHIKINKEVYGNQAKFYLEIIKAVFGFPFSLLRNKSLKFFNRK